MAKPAAPAPAPTSAPTPAAAPTTSPAVALTASDQTTAEAVVTTKIHGIEFPLASAEILASREYEDRVVVVTRDGRKLEIAK